MSEEKFNRGVGLDVGTMNFLSARKSGDKVVTKKMRDAFLDLESTSKQFLKLSGVNYIEKNDSIIIVGDEALHVANLFNREVRRPLKDGMISNQELDSYDVISLMVEQLLGTPVCEKEICYFSVPAAPIDVPDRDVIFHEGVFRRIIQELGYDARPFNEAAAICFSEASKDNFSALTMSFGAGLTNIALTFKTMTTMTFSLSRAGDWIDANTAKASNTTASRIAALKEKEADLLDFHTGDPRFLRSREALQVYYKALIDYTLDHVEKEFKKIADTITIPEPLPLIIAGGTSMAKNFVPFFRQEFEKRKAKFSIPIKEIRHATDPLGSVAKGLLVNASINY